MTFVPWANTNARLRKTRSRSPVELSHFVHALVQWDSDVGGDGLECRLHSTTGGEAANFRLLDAVWHATTPGFLGVGLARRVRMVISDPKTRSRESPRIVRFWWTEFSHLTSRNERGKPGTVMILYAVTEGNIAG